MQKKVIKNAAWIIGCKVVKAILMFITTAITARYLGVAKYGIINYAAGIVAFVVPIMQLGFGSTIVHEIVNRPDEEGKVVGTVMSMSSVSALFCILGVFAFTSIVNAGETDTIIVCTIYSVMLLFQALEIIYCWFHAKLMSKYSAMAMLFAYIASAIFQIILVLIKANIYFFAISFSLDYFVIAAILIFIYKRKSNQKLSFSFSLAKQLFSVSRFYIVSSLMLTIFVQTDRIMLKLMVGDVETGLYSAAYTCANMFNFVFAAIIDSMRPEIFNAKRQSQEAFEYKMSELYSVIIYFSLFVCVMMTLFAPLIIKIMYGSQYLEAVNMLRVAVWFSTFSYCGAVRNIWILAEEKQKYMWIINTSGAVMNIVLNYFLIPVIGGMGAAVASVVTQMFIILIIDLIIKPIRRNSLLMVKGLNPKYVKSIFTAFKKKSEDVE